MMDPRFSAARAAHWMPLLPPPRLAALLRPLLVGEQQHQLHMLCGVMPLHSKPLDRRQQQLTTTAACFLLRGRGRSSSTQLLAGQQVGEPRLVLGSSSSSSSSSSKSTRLGIRSNKQPVLMLMMVAHFSQPRSPQARSLPPVLHSHMLSPHRHRRPSTHSSSRLATRSSRKRVVRGMAAHSSLSQQPLCKLNSSSSSSSKRRRRLFGRSKSRQQPQRQ